MGEVTQMAASAAPGLVVALDGPGSSGKSTVGAAAAARLGYRFFDTGLLYRAVTWLAIRRGIADDAVPDLVRLVDSVEMAADAAGQLSRVLVDGEDVGAALHDPDVDARVSRIAGIPQVRAALVGRQRTIAEGGAIVMAGRDIGTVILPDADLKLYIDASVEERARRRAGELQGVPGGPGFQAVLEGLRRRDALDRDRAVAPLRPADDARILTTDGNDVEETVKLVVDTVREAEQQRAAADPGALDPGALRVPPAPGSERVAERVDGRPPGAGSAAGTGPRRPLPVSRMADRLTPLIRFCSTVGRLLARAFTKVRIEGDLASIPHSGPVLIIANHASNADGLVLGAFLPPRIGRPFNWLGKREMFDVPVLGWLAVRGGVHAVERSAVDLEAFRTAQRVLDAGQLLVVFPEGTRSPNGALQPVKDGLAMLAQRRGVPVVPIAIVGSDLVWPRSRRLPHLRGEIVVRVGAPFTLAAGEPDPGVDRRSAKSAATRRMMGAIAAMLPSRQRGAYGEAAGAARQLDEAGGERG